MSDQHEEFDREDQVVQLSIDAELDQDHAFIRDHLPELAAMLYGGDFDGSEFQAHLLVAAAKLGMRAVEKEEI